MADSKNIPQNLKYTKDHEWARLEADNSITVGITAHAQDSLGEVVYVDLPEKNRSVNSHETFGVVESIKAVSDLYAPISGTIVETNESVRQQPTLINESPYEGGWLVRIKPSSDDFSKLLSPSEYQNLTEA